MTGIAPIHLLGVESDLYHDSGLADEVLGHLEALALAQQKEYEKQTGKKVPQARKRPAFKKREASDA